MKPVQIKMHHCMQQSKLHAIDSSQTTAIGSAQAIQRKQPEKYEPQWLSSLFITWDD